MGLGTQVGGESGWLVGSGQGRRKTECVPMRRHTTCASPDRISGPYPKVARPSGAQVISQTLG
jgi:hypothetical protein